MNFIFTLIFITIYTFIIFDLGCSIFVYSLIHCSDNEYKKTITALDKAREEEKINVY